MAVNRSVPYIQQEHWNDGTRYPNIVLDSSLEALPTFEVRPDDIWILTFPKSGTHWMIEIISLILADGFPDKVNRTYNSSTISMINMNQVFPKTTEDEKLLDMTPFMTIIDRAPSPRVIISHLRVNCLPKDAFKKAKVVYVARNPKDTLNSWHNFVGRSAEYPLSFEENIQAFMAGETHWGPWFDHVDEFWKLRGEKNLLYLFYEDLKKDLMTCVRKVADHIRPLSDEALHRVVQHSTFAGMTKSYENMAASGLEMYTKSHGKFSYLNKGTCGQWKGRFTVAQNEEFDKWLQEKMSTTDLTFQFE